jgi:hypothetical protein
VIAQRHNVTFQRALETQDEFYVCNECVMRQQVMVDQVVSVLSMEADAVMEV